MKRTDALRSRGAKAPAPKPSALVAKLAAEKETRGLRWDFPPQALADIAEVKRLNASGEAAITRTRLARGLVEAYALPVGWRTVAERIKADLGW